MENFTILNSSEETKWNNYLAELPQSQQDIYFTPEYYKLYENLGDGHAQCFVFNYEGNLALYPFLINSVNKLGYTLKEEYFDIQGAYGYNGVISSTYDEIFINKFYETFEKYCIENKIIAEFVRFHPVLNNHQFSQHHLTLIEDRTTVYIDITKDYDLIWSNFYSPENRNKIRKAEDSGLEISISEDYSLFIKLYVETMKRVNAADYYFFNDKYFYDIPKFLKNNQKLLIAKDRGTVVGGAIVLTYSNYAHMHLAASNRSLMPKGTNNLIYNTAIKYSINARKTLVHMGGGINNDKSDPLFKFKSSFSKTSLPFYIGKKIYNEEIYQNVVEQWQLKYPEKLAQYQKLLLKYRY